MDLTNFGYKCPSSVALARCLNLEYGKDSPVIATLGQDTSHPLDILLKKVYFLVSTLQMLNDIFCFQL